MDLTERDITNKLVVASTYTIGERLVRVLFLMPTSMWRPLRVSWWKGKEVSIIGGDEHGNYLLRHCDGSVRLWNHAVAADEVLAPSVRAFFSGLQPPGV